MSEEIKIRKFKASDRAALREINYNTALLGDPAEKFFDDREIFTDALTRYFTDYEPQSCFVAESGKEIAGYLIGAKDTCVAGSVLWAAR